MTNILQVPLLPEVSDQNLSVELSGTPYSIRVLWNESFGYYSMSLLEADETPILSNIKMVKNYDLTGRFKHPKMPPGVFALVQEKGSTDRPGYADFGSSFNLYYIEP